MCHSKDIKGLGDCAVQTIFTAQHVVFVRTWCIHRIYWNIIRNSKHYSPLDIPAFMWSKMIIDKKAMSHDFQFIKYLTYLVFNVKQEIPL